LVNVAILKSTRVPPGAYDSHDFQCLAAHVFVLQKVRGSVELSIDVTGHKRIQELNRRFRGVDRTTDVISFRNDSGHGARGTKIEGDIAINVHQAALQAKRMRHPLRREMRLLLIHGILHLLGFTDYEPGPRRRMFKRQNAILRNWEAKLH
jgi:probable rRNA maturation factor